MPPPPPPAPEKEPPAGGGPRPSSSRCGFGMKKSKIVPWDLSDSASRLRLQLPCDGASVTLRTEAGTYETASTTPKRRTTAACLLTASGGACVAGGVDLGPIYGTASATPPFSSP